MTALRECVLIGLAAALQIAVLVLARLAGIRDASRKHDAMARRKYVKPFKWFKFNRARRATAK